MTKTVKAEPLLEGIHIELAFDNGFGASILSHGFARSHGILWEVGVKHRKELCYGSSVTSDVIGGIGWDEMLKVVERIKALDAKENCTHKAKEEGYDNTAY